ncbi:MAG TPA: GTP-binding protein, partial [Candidatus Hodarchaeales archaeon]|nr:GTP-binding protein [Candidatus Hodarchaeales archaeon]
MKVPLIGDNGSGKTELRRRYLGDGVNTSYIHSIGADFAVHKSESLQQVKIQIWDLNSSARFTEVRRSYYRGSHGAVVTFDVNNRRSFNAVPYWISALWHHCRQIVPVVILGNMQDRAEPERSVTFDEGVALAESYNRRLGELETSLQYIETSAVTGINVASAFETLGRNVALNPRPERSLQWSSAGRLLAEAEELVFEVERGNFEHLDDSETYSVDAPAQIWNDEGRYFSRRYFGDGWLTAKEKSMYESLESVRVRCSGHGQFLFFKEAVMAEWLLCGICGMIIYPKCFEMFTN